MSSKITAFLLGFLLCSSVFAQQNSDNSFLIAFGSCNKVGEPNPFWEQISNLKPDVFIWGGDNIYADTGNMNKMRKMYAEQDRNPAYAKVKQTVPIMATWDDHDYGKNDAGRNWSKKEESQQLFLDFLDVPKTDIRREQEGVYYSQNFEKKGRKIKIIALDTRYFRSKLKPSPDPEKRYIPAQNDNATLLGEKQWEWLENELKTSKADYIFIVSSIQFLSAEHGFETWGNFPLEVARFIDLLKKSRAKRVVILSGDRHISEFSTKNIEGTKDPLIDFTSSGLTHAYTEFDGEPNQYRVGKVVAQRSFGTVSIDLENDQVVFKMWGATGEMLQKMEQNY